MYSDSSTSGTTHAFRFTGSGGEYFGVWIVNILLSVITLGIYSAWAKVRNKQYFYGNTLLDGASFEYTASPLTILKGRLIVVVFFVVYSIIANIQPGIEPFMYLAVVVLVPWVVNRALAFNARYSSLRNLRFWFSARYGETFMVFLVLPALAFLSIGALWPYAAYRKNRFVVEHSGYGGTWFAFDGRPGRFYAVYLLGGAIVLAAAGVVGALAAVMIPALGGAELLEPPAGGELNPVQSLVMLIVFVFSGTVLVAVGVYVQTRITNYVWQSTRLRQNRFDMRLQFLSMLWIQASNLVLIVLTMGIWIPFAKVRVFRYRIQRLSVNMLDSMDRFVAGERARVGALGEEFGDALDLDLGL